MATKPNSDWVRVLLRVVWLAAVLIAYRTAIDIGPQGSSTYVLHLLVILAIFALGDEVLGRLWSRWHSPDAGGAAAGRASASERTGER